MRKKTNSMLYGGYFEPYLSLCVPYQNIQLVGVSIIALAGVLVVN